MERIASFSIDHLILKPGLYVSRKDKRDGVTVTTFDIRLTAPNREPVVDMPALHTIEHLGATYLRNGRRRDEIVYFGPMGCQTGFYLLVRNADNAEVLEVVLGILGAIAEYDGAMPGESRVECGNYKNLDVGAARAEAARYLAHLTSREQDFKYKEAPCES